MNQFFSHYTATSRIHTTISSFPFYTCHGRVTNRTLRRHFKKCFTTIALIFFYRRHFRNNFPCFIYTNGIPYTNIFFPNKVHIMQCSTFHNRSCQTYRYQISRRCQYARTPHRNHNTFHFCYRFFRWILIGNRPFRIFSRST